MKKKCTLFLYIALMVLLTNCTTHETKKQIASVEIEESETEAEDGIREAQEMEFEMTRDPKLGYIPVSRLVNAYNIISKERLAGRYESISALNWIERGPNSNVLGPSNGNLRGPVGTPVVCGRMRAIHVDLTDATNKTVWIGSVSGGLWKTTDITASPANWTLINDFIGNLAISSICQDPVNKNIMYFSTGERNNNGDAVRGGGIWKSINNGATWNLLANTVGFWNTSKIVCDAIGNVYVGTNGNNQGLQRSTNGGANWENITPGTGTRVTDIRVSTTGRLHLTMGNGTVAGSGSFYTDNPSTVTSASWILPNTPIPNLINNCEITVAGNVLYALPEGANAQTPQIYKSIDGGDNWTATITSPPSPSTEPTINSGQGWYDLAIGVDPNNTDIVVAGGLNFYRTTDGGVTWTQITRWVGTVFNYVHADHHGVVWNGSQVLLATDGGIFYSSDNGFSYSDRNVGIRTIQFYSCAIHPTNNFFLGGTQDNGAHSIAGNGIQGSIEVHGGDGGFTHIDEDEPQFQFSATTRSNYRRSINGGVNWSSASFSSTIGQFINPTDYDDINNRMYCSAGNGTYVRWDNAQAGTSFSTISIASVTPNSVRSIKVSPFTSNRVFMGTTNGVIIKIDNAEQANPIVTNVSSNMPQTNNTFVSSVNIGTNDNFLLASFSNYGIPHVWFTSNGGTSWGNISGNLPDIPVRSVMFYPNNNDKALIATEMGVFETEDINGAATVWVQNSTFPTVKTNMLQYRFSDNTVLAATHGRGMWSSQFTPDLPYVRFNSTYNYSKVNTESSTATVGCRSFTDYIVNMHIDAAPAGDAAVTLNTATSTAVEGIDYDITTNGSFSSPSKILTFPNGVTGNKPITIRVYNDVLVENQETVTITYAIGVGTNAVAAPGSFSYSFFIGDNDVAPEAGVTVVETDLNATKTNDVRGTAVHSFFSQNNRVLMQVSAATATLGCVSSTIFESGAIWQSFLSGNRSQKVFDITTSENAGSFYTISLYVTAAELAGKTPSTLQITSTTAATLAGANGSNTSSYTTSFIAFGSDYVFTSTVPSVTVAKFFLTEGVVTSLFDANRNREHFAKLLLNPVMHTIPLFINNTSRKKVTAVLFMANGSLLKRWEAGTVEGNLNLSLNNLFLAPGIYLLQIEAGTKKQTFQLQKQ